VDRATSSTTTGSTGAATSRRGSSPTCSPPRCGTPSGHCASRVRRRPPSPATTPQVLAGPRPADAPRTGRTTDASTVPCFPPVSSPGPESPIGDGAEQRGCGSVAGRSIRVPQPRRWGTVPARGAWGVGSGGGEGGGWLVLDGGQGGDGPAFPPCASRYERPEVSHCVLPGSKTRERWHISALSGVLGAVRQARPSS
jgi:hypothetical protein